MIPKVTYFHMFLHVIMVKVLLHPSNVTPVKVPISIADNAHLMVYIIRAKLLIRFIDSNQVETGRVLSLIKVIASHVKQKETNSSLKYDKS